MSKFRWVRFKKYQGVKYKGSIRFDPLQPWGIWTKILGVLARCEGCFDSVVSYDNTGITWGMGQHTFTSGRLQKLLESFKSIPDYDFERTGEGDWTLFDEVCKKGPAYLGRQIFNEFGFSIKGGRFVDLIDTYESLDPRIKKEKQRIVDICMGRVQYKTFKDQKAHAMRLAKVFANIGQQFGVADAQIQFAKQEFKRSLGYKRPPLGDIKTIGNLLEGTWDTPAPALFFNLWQNNPGAAFRLFKRVYKSGVRDTTKDGWDFFELAWKKANRSRFGNWGFGKSGNKSPRVIRIKKAIKEFYGVDLGYHR